MSKKNKIIVVILVLTILLVGWISYLYISYKNSHRVIVQTQEPEKAGEAQVQLINGVKLYDLTTPAKYSAIKIMLAYYVQAKKGDPYGRVNIVGEPIVDPLWGYSLLFKIQIPELNKTLDVTATSSRDGSLVTLKIPSENYTSVREITY
jgi:hypothetical protein